MSFELTHNSYGKSRVRLTKVVRRGARHDLYEFSVDVQLEGDFAPAYLEGDNRLVVATDTMKNTVYVVAKEQSFDSPEAFAAILARHFLATYAHVSKATVEVHQAAWNRINGHDHAFTAGGTHSSYARALHTRSGVTTLVGGVRGLKVLKTTASEWADFHRDRYRTLADVKDRIFATAIDATWLYAAAPEDPASDRAAIEDAFLRVFATTHSVGAQRTLQQMGEAALTACPAVSEVSIELPNLHRIPFNLEPFGLKFENDVFVATDEPHGLIKGVIRRG